MVNIFGDRESGATGARGPVGPRGLKGVKGDHGKSGINDMCRWIPDLVLEQFQTNETCCFKLTDPSTDLHKDKSGAYVTWISRSASKMNAVADDPSKQVLHISKEQNALVFDKSLYYVDGIVVAPLAPSYVYMCVTFQVEGEHDQTIVSNYDPANPHASFREISASNKEIRIWDAKTKTSYVPIEHKTKKNEWTTILVQWSDHDGFYLVNGKEIVGAFTCKGVGFQSTGINIGGRYDGSRSLKGAISSFEIYVVGKTHDAVIPDSLMNLIISRQMISNVSEAPPMKKKRI